MDVLLVEDDLLIREMLCEHLADAGIDVVQAPNGEEGLDAAERSGPPPSVLVTDVNLGPGMDGIELAREARWRWPLLHVVVITGDPANLAAMSPELRAGCLLKPFNPPRLLAAVAAALLRRRG